MALLYLFNKPFRVMSQFSAVNDKQVLADYINEPDIYPAGRLDYDSEGLLLLTGDGKLQARIADPKHKLPKHYWVQVEGSIDEEAISKLENGVMLNDGPTKKAQAKRIPEPALWERDPPIRKRSNQETSWIELIITEGRNRQVRRMTASVGYPTLRLIRHRIGPWSIDHLNPGELKQVKVHLAAQSSSDKNAHPSRKRFSPNAKKRSGTNTSRGRK